MNKHTPQNYTKKAVMVQAMLYDGTEDSDSAVIQFAKDANKQLYYDPNGVITVPVDGGYVGLTIGDYIIKDAENNITACKPDIFALTYDAVVVPVASPPSSAKPKDTTGDRELLELAAKAAGKCLHAEVTHEYGNWGCDTTCVKCGKDPSSASWNPLTDDGDRYRLAQKLRISIDFRNSEAWAKYQGEFIREAWGGDCGDEAHAILRVAAEISRRM